MKTSETWGVEYQNNRRSHPNTIPVGSWRPVIGPKMSDALFIHVSHGFRGKIIPIVSFHVISIILNWIFKIVILIFS